MRDMLCEMKCRGPTTTSYHHCQNAWQDTSVQGQFMMKTDSEISSCHPAAFICYGNTVNWSLGGIYGTKEQGTDELITLLVMFMVVISFHDGHGCVMMGYNLGVPHDMKFWTTSHHFLRMPPWWDIVRISIGIILEEYIRLQMRGPSIVGFFFWMICHIDNDDQLAMNPALQNFE